MSYTMEIINDLVQGSIMSIKIPLEQVDHIALETMTSSPPPFLVPFQQHLVNQEVQLLYSLQSVTPLRYLREQKGAVQYVEFWNQVLLPLTICDDWFMKPFCFLFDVNNIFLNGKTGRVSYFYVPMKQESGSITQLQMLMIELSKIITPQDVGLENRVLRELQSFQLNDFLAMLKEYSSGQLEQNPVATVSPTPVGTAPPVDSVPSTGKGTGLKIPSFGKVATVPPVVPKEFVPPMAAASAPPLPVAECKESVFSFAEIGNQGKKSEQIVPAFENLMGDDFQFEAPVKKTGGLFGKKEPKPPKAPKQAKEGFSFKKEKPVQSAVLGGTGNLSEDVSNPFQKPMQTSNSAGFPQDEYAGYNDDDGLTQISMDETPIGSIFLRKVGIATTPQEILLTLEEGVPFLIGRFDVSKGVQQCNFEFPKDTRGVSRRHCVLEKQHGTFSLVDLASKGGTSINGQKLEPNIPHLLQSGDRISFGFSGVDYIFEG